MHKVGSLNYEIIIGRHPVLTAIRMNRSIREVLILRHAGGPVVRSIIEEAGKRDIPVRFGDQDSLDELAGDKGRHQGVLAIAEPKGYVSMEEVIQLARDRGEAPLLVMLDSVQDPQNLGAIMRSAESFGVHGLVIPERRACGVTPAVIKASCGAWEYLPVARVKNLSRAIDLAKEQGLWIVGALAEAEKPIFDVDLRGSIGIVLGGEDRGISRLAAEKCDFLVRIPTMGCVPSLNVSVACGIILYEAIRQRGTGILSR